MKFILLFFCLLSFLAFSWAEDKLSSTSPDKFTLPIDERGRDKGILLKIQRGMSLDQVAELLKKKGLIKNIFYFKLLARFKGISEKLKSGEYVFRPGLSYADILNMLVRGKTRLYRITFPEGYNLYEMAELLEQGQFLNKKDFISFCTNPKVAQELLGGLSTDLEGYLFPDTYYVHRPLKPRVLVQKMVQNFFKQAHRLQKKHLKGVDFPLGLSFHEWVILASVVEKETGVAEERPLIASVFFNRLKKGQRLESDPTILYGMMREAGGLVPLNIRKKDIQRKTPYNTYRIAGFPATPIGNPGAGALRAVLKPADSAYFYFVSRNDGSHVFSKTYAKHNKAVDRYQRGIKPSQKKPLR